MLIAPMLASPHLGFSNFDMAANCAALTYFGKRIFNHFIVWWRRKSFTLNAGFTITLTHQRKNQRTKRQPLRTARRSLVKKAKVRVV